MVKEFSKYKFVLIFICIFVLVSLFPLTGSDLIYNTSELKNIENIFTIQPTSILVNTILLHISKIKILRTIIVSILGTSMFILLKNVVNKKNSSLMFLGFFFFLLIDKEVFASSFVNLTGFVNHFVGSLFLMIILNLFYKNSVNKMKNILLLILGLIGTSMNPVYSFVFFVATILYIFFEKDSNYENKYFFLITGEIIGILLLIFNLNLEYTSFSHNLIRKLIPRYSGSNFIITLIMSILILVEAMKMFTYGKRLNVCLSSLGIMIYLFTSLLVKMPIINYLAYLFNFFANMYILMNMKNSRLFQRKIVFYYGIKLIYIIMSCLIGSIGEANMLFLSLLDILIILELYNGLFPCDFLKYIWMIGCIFVVGAYAYIYSRVLARFDELNFFMKNALECQAIDYRVPERLETEYLFNYVPTSVEELEGYIEYYEINLYGDIKKVDFHFEKLEN